MLQIFCILIHDIFLHNSLFSFFSSLQSSVEKYELNIYTKKDFRQAISQKSYPLNVVVHDHLFAEALIKAGMF